MGKLHKGYVQVYTGDGKGKTTAALGLTLRAVGVGLKVYFGQFLKGRSCGEIFGLEYLSDRVTLERFGSGRWVNKEKEKEYQEEVTRAQKGVLAVKCAVTSGEFDLVVMDEALGALKQGVISLEDIFSIIALKPEGVELVITGRNAPEKLIERADLVSEIKQVKHYYAAGVKARKGIEF